MIDKIARSPEDIGLRRFPKFMGVILAEATIAVKRFLTSLSTSKFFKKFFVGTAAWQGGTGGLIQAAAVVSRGTRALPVWRRFAKLQVPGGTAYNLL
jgi:hypothetical protein